MKLLRKYIATTIFFSFTFSYYGVVTLIPIFQYSNVYAVTSKLKELAENIKLQERCIAYASKLRMFYISSEKIYKI